MANARFCGFLALAGLSVVVLPTVMADEYAYPGVVAPTIDHCDVNVFPSPGLDCPVTPGGLVRRFTFQPGNDIVVSVNDVSGQPAIFLVVIEGLRTVCIQSCAIGVLQFDPDGGAFVTVSVDSGDITPNEYLESAGNYVIPTKGTVFWDWIN